MPDRQECTQRPLHLYCQAVFRVATDCAEQSIKGSGQVAGIFAQHHCAAHPVAVQAKVLRARNGHQQFRQLRRHAAHAEGIGVQAAPQPLVGQVDHWQKATLCGEYSTALSIGRRSGRRPRGCGNSHATTRHRRAPQWPGWPSCRRTGFLGCQVEIRVGAGRQMRRGHEHGVVHPGRVTQPDACLWSCQCNQIEQ